MIDHPPAPRPLPRTIRSSSAEQTEAAGRELASLLGPGDVVCLMGPLGSGKTVFAKGIAAALGVAEPVTSPSFIIAQRYEGRLGLYHLDLYRLRDLAEVEGLGFDEILASGAVVLIEWGEKAGALLPEDRVDVTFRIEEDGSRTISLEVRQ